MIIIYFSVKANVKTVNISMRPVGVTMVGMVNFVLKKFVRKVITEKIANKSAVAKWIPRKGTIHNAKSIVSKSKYIHVCILGLISSWTRQIGNPC